MPTPCSIWPSLQSKPARGQATILKRPHIVAPVAIRQNTCRPACGLGTPAAPWPRWPSATARARARCCKRPSGPALSNGAQARCCKRASALGRGVRKSCVVVRIFAGCAWILWTFLGSVQRLMQFVERLRLCDDWTLNSMTVSRSANTKPSFLRQSQALQQLYHEF